ncbi:hypothetical protein [Rhodopirellula bahusiensis]|uniref:Uncharacterized protein n=1 Tax=Rhodopirellula bahusiensis TaxID=2014065 RepID=A0A2G1W5L0_9BACT|nr:hypothetical protein [Rhodopirellula bahusiensis]PHQ34317.1 hypothetical protein CEE69_14940 [Rhodopirellula bahusiensis]
MTTIELTIGQPADIESQSVHVVRTAMHKQGSYPSQRAAAFIEIGDADEVAHYVGDAVQIGDAKFHVQHIEVGQPAGRVLLDPVG